MSMTKTEAKTLRKGDYIPGGSPISREEFNQLEFRRTTESEVFQCGMQTGNDVQSGPYFCGEIAEFIANYKHGVIALCGKHGHSPPIKR